jgi:hypothetical protein
VSQYPPALAANSLYGKRGQAYTADGDNPLKPLRVEYVPSSPETVEDYVKTVDFRFLALQRWIESSENKLALETIARIEGDLQQIRLLLKGAKKLVEGATDCPTCGGPRTLQSNFMPHCQNCCHPESVPCNAYCPLVEG